MKPKLKKIEDQVMVITGASSGIGLATARRAAKKGAQLVLFARNEEALRKICDELNAADGKAIYAAGDVANLDDLRRLAEVALASFGRIDTWVNDAGISIYGELEQTPLEDAHRLFDTNYWGLVHGSLLAVECLKESGGALINMGSVTSDRAMPLQGHYVASKQAVKGFTDSLRMEIEHNKYPISVTLIKPTGVDTPYPDHAENLMEQPPRNPPPLYQPGAVAQAIVYAAEHPVRDLFIGSAAKLFSSSEKHMPRTTDKLMERALYAGQHSHKPREDGPEGALWAPGRDGDERSRRGFYARRHSYYTHAVEHPLLSVALAAGCALAATAALAATGAGAAASASGRGKTARRDFREPDLNRPELLPPNRTTHSSDAVAPAPAAPANG